MTPAPGTKLGGYEIRSKIGEGGMGEVLLNKPMVGRLLNKVLNVGAVSTVKIGIDYLKHVTTLSTGSIILIATLLEKLFAKPAWKPFVVVSLVGFMSCVLCSTVAYTLSVAYSFPGEHDDTDTSKSDVVTGVCITLVWISFAVGVLALWRLRDQKLSGLTN